jgi:hypothetical protein
LSRAVSALALAAALTLVPHHAPLAATGTVVGTEMNGFGRIVFTFDKPVKAAMRATSGVVVVSFDQSLTLDVGKVAAQAPGYLSVVRIDPDGRTVRFATTRPLRVNIIEAGEKVFVDFMPESWQGLPPRRGNPQDPA